MRGILPFLVLFSITESVGAQPRDPCEGRLGVVDGIDEDDVLCDAKAHQAALDRFAVVTAAADAAKFVQPACDPQNKAATKSKLDGSAEWIKAADRSFRSEGVTDRQIAQLRQAIATEKANPTGTVDLVKLHSLGEDLQIQTSLKTQQHAEATNARSRAAKLMAEAKAAMDACKKASASSSSP